MRQLEEAELSVPLSGNQSARLAVAALKLTDRTGVDGLGWLDGQPDTAPGTTETA